MKRPADLQEVLQSPEFSGYLDGVGQLEGAELEELLELAREFARAEITGFKVGALALGESGKVYLGANMEFIGSPLQASLHAEQSAVLNAWMHGESVIKWIAVSETPCGHCRQFLLELQDAAKLSVSVKGTTRKLSELIPDAFSMEHPSGTGLLDSPPHALISAGSAANQSAVDEASRSYTPYSQSPEGFILETESEKQFAGRTAESSALNPSVPAALTALNQMNLSAQREEPIRRGVHAMLENAQTHSLELSKSLIGGICSEPVESVFFEQVSKSS